MAGMIARCFVRIGFRSMCYELSPPSYAASFSCTNTLSPSIGGWRYFRSSSMILCHQATKTSTVLDQCTNSSVAAEKSADLLADLTPEETKRLKVLKLEYDVFYSSGVRVPNVVSDEEWLYLLRQCSSVSSRKRRYVYLFKTEKSIDNKRLKARINTQKQEEKRAHIKQMQKEGRCSFLNSFMLFVQEHTMNRHYQNNLAYSMMNGPHLVFDFSFEHVMSDHELTDLIKQVQLCHGDNKVVREPFHFHFCNLTPGSRTDRKLHRGMQNLDSLPISVTHQSYTDCYPRESLVYLSPNAPTLLQKLDPDDVYIVGGIVDRAVEDPLTFAKAKKENIRTARFPLDKYVK